MHMTKIKQIKKISNYVTETYNKHSKAIIIVATLFLISILFSGLNWLILIVLVIPVGLIVLVWLYSLLIDIGLGEKNSLIIGLIVTVTLIVLGFWLSNAGYNHEDSMCWGSLVCE